MTKLTNLAKTLFKQPAEIAYRKNIKLINSKAKVRDLAKIRANFFIRQLHKKIENTELSNKFTIVKIVIVENADEIEYRYRTNYDIYGNYNLCSQFYVSDGLLSKNEIMEIYEKTFTDYVKASFTGFEICRDNVDIKDNTLTLVMEIDSLETDKQ